MGHLHKELGALAEGSTVVVGLAAQADVHLMTSFEHANYTAGRRYQFYGRRVTESPFKIVVPRDGDWVVVIDAGRLDPDSLGARVGVNPPPAGYVPGLRAPRVAALERIELRTPVDPPAGVLGGQTWDVYLAHAPEDRLRVGRPLREALVAQGLSTWLEEVSADPAQTLAERLDERLPSARVAVVVLSAGFFGHGWDQAALDDLARVGPRGAQVLLHLWHEVGAGQVRGRSEALASAAHLVAGDRSTEELAGMLADLVRGPGPG